MRVHVVDRDEFGPAAADVVLAELPSESATLGVATGETPLVVYRELGIRSARGAIDFSSVVLVALDEYVGLGAGDQLSYAAYVRDTIAAPLAVREMLVPDGTATDPDDEAAAFEEAIVALDGIDVQIAGLGGNGHLAFNEPGSAFDSTTRTVTLSDRTRRDNARFFAGRVEDVPTRAITQGLGTICRAKSIVLLALGTQKAGALAAALRGPVDPAVPASILQQHSRVTVIVDHAAAARL